MTYQQLIAILEQDYDRLALEMVKSIRHAENALAAVDVRMQQLKAGMLTKASGK